MVIVRSFGAASQRPSERCTQRGAMPPPDDDRAVDDASQALSELSTNVNDFLRMQAKVGTPSLVERLPRREKTRRCRPHAGDARASRTRRAPRATVTEPTPAQRGDDEPSKPLSPASAAPAERKGDDGDAVPGVKDLHAMQDRIAGLLDGMRDAAAAAEAK